MSISFAVPHDLNNAFGPTWKYPSIAGENTRIKKLSGLAGEKIKHSILSAKLYHNGFKQFQPGKGNG
jgi:hypothetical protein